MLADAVTVVCFAVGEIQSSRGRPLCDTVCTTSDRGLTLTRQDASAENWAVTLSGSEH